MPQARQKPSKKQPAALPTASVNGLAQSAFEVFTLADAAAYLRVAEDEIMRLVAYQALPGRQLGGDWRFLKSALQDWLRTPPTPGSREAVMSTFGALKDPNVEEELKEIYRKRREDTIGDDE